MKLNSAFCNQWIVLFVKRQKVKMNKIEVDETKKEKRTH